MTLFTKKTYKIGKRFITQPKHTEMQHKLPRLIESPNTFH